MLSGAGRLLQMLALAALAGLGALSYLLLLLGVLTWRFIWDHGLASRPRPLRPSA